MDPISVGYLILTLVQVTSSAFKLVNSIKYSAPKVDLIYYRLLAEKETTEAWASQMRHMNGTDLRTSVPPEKYHEVSKLLGKLSEYLKQAERKYAKVELKSADQRNTVANLRARALFVLSGYDDLKDLVDAIAVMNKALTTIAPTLPPYSRQMYSEGSTIPIVQRDYLPQVIESASRSETAQSSTLRPDTEISSTLASPDRAKDETEHTFLHLPSLKRIYVLSLEALRNMSQYRAHKLLANATARLTLWGAGLFEDIAPLDSILGKEEKEVNALREAFLKAMTHILVLEERDLNRLETQGTVQSKINLGSLQTEISSMLGTDELVESALEQWAHFLQRHNTESSGQSTTLQPADLQHDEVEAETDYRSISQIIEILFDLLPAIRSERRAHCVRIEAKESAQDSDRLSTSGISQTQSTIEDDMHKIEDFIRRRDQRAIKQGRQVTMFEPVFRKERDRLEELRLAKVTSSKGVEVTRDLQALRDKKEQFSKILSTFVRAMDSKPTTNNPSSAAAMSKDSMASHTSIADVKARLAETQLSDDENLGAFIQSLRGLTI